MGKNNRHKKFLKQEKAKVKLKGSKKLLLKGQNITDTSFKVKKIVLQTQLTSTPEGEPQTKRKLNLKDLLSRINHYSSNMRQEAVSGLRELACMHPETLNTNLCSYIESSAALCIDLESVVRQEALRLLHYILEKVSTVQLEPFMAMLVSYLSVGLSHLHRNVQEDALRMLDAVLAVAPTLVARAAPLLLPAFLDQISVRRSSGGTERTLSLDLQSANTSTRWRIKVLGRLHAMLSAAASPASSCVSKPREVHMSPNMSPYVSINLRQQLDEICIIPGLFSKGGANLLAQQQLFQDDEQMKKYIMVLMPLLFETWIEVGPSQKQTREIGSLITSEAAELLECVLETMQHLWNYLETTEQRRDSKELTSWFGQNFRANFVRHLVDHFPYCTSEEDGKSKGRRSSKGQLPFEEERVRSCGNQNLAVCHLFCCLCDQPSSEQAHAIISYTTRCMQSGQHTSEQLIRVLRCLLTQGTGRWQGVGVSIAPLAQAAVQSCLSRREKAEFSTSPLFNLLCDVSLATARANTERQVADSSYCKFVEELPSVLTEEKISEKALNTIIQLAVVSDPLVLQGVKLYLTRIVENLARVTVPGMQQDVAQTSMLSVLFRASKWRVDILESVARQLQSASVSPHLRDHFRQLLELEEAFQPNSAVGNKLNTMAWFMHH